MGEYKTYKKPQRSNKFGEVGELVAINIKDIYLPSVEYPEEWKDPETGDLRIDKYGQTENFDHNIKYLNADLLVESYEEEAMTKYDELDKRLILLEHLGDGIYREIYSKEILRLTEAEPLVKDAETFMNVYNAAKKYPLTFSSYYPLTDEVKVEFAQNKGLEQDIIRLISLLKQESIKDIEHYMDGVVEYDRNQAYTEDVIRSVR